MHTDNYTKFLLTLVALFLGMLALRPLVQPLPVQAQTEPPRFYIEPGYTMLRKADGEAQLLGKMVVDLNTGQIWGFPTLVKGPYPVDVTTSTPPVSRPMYLGKFDFAAMKSAPR